ncbi:unnamed protein product [Ectocarpus sp. 8 AP-2014]
MDVHGTRPLGVNWYRLLSVYSDLGKKTNSHEKICDIGTELQSFRADVETAMQGINTKLDDLINANKIQLSGDDLTKLKDDIVSGLKDHVQRSGQQCAAPVVCDGESLLFTDDVKELLENLVQQKASVSENLGNMALDIAEIKTWGDKGISYTEHDARKLGEWFEGLQNTVNRGFERADDRNTPGTEAFNNRLEPLSKAVAGKLLAEDAPLTKAFIDNIEQASNAVVEKISAKDGPIAEAFVVNQEAFSNAVVERVLAKDGPLAANFSSIVEALSTALVQKVLAGDAPFAAALAEKLCAQDGLAALSKAFADNVFSEDGPFNLAFVTNLEALSEAVVARIFAEDGPLIARLGRREGLSLAESKKLAEEVADRVWKADGPGSNGVTEAMQSLLLDPISKISAILEIVAMPDGFDTELYTKSVGDVRTLFETKNSALNVKGDHRTRAQMIGFFSRYVVEYSGGPYTKSDVLTKKQFTESVSKRLTETEFAKEKEKISKFLDDMLVRFQNDISKLQMLNSYLVEEGL